MESRHVVAPPVWWVLWAAAAVIVRLLSEGILEAGDGIQHYQIARFSWKHPELYLDHWGKPLFTLLASPFAQLGHWGVALFNALCFAATCWAADGILRRAGALASWLYAPAILLAPVYGTMVLAGMTEILFGLLAVLVVRALVDQRPVLAAAIASFMPYSRPEYVAFVPAVLLWLAWHRQWRALPWLLLGHLAYGALGAFHFGDALWYFHRDPYVGAADIYGSGDLDHFWLRREQILGGPLLWVLALALPVAALLWWRKAEDRPMLRLLIVVALLPALGIAVLHSILWWKGLKGSLGLVRVLATAVPLFVLFAVWTVSRAVALWTGPGWRTHLVSSAFILPYTFFGVRAFQAEQTIPVATHAELEFLDRTGDHLAAMPLPKGRTIVFHPYIAYRSGLDPFDMEHVSLYWPGSERFVPGDRLVWDAHFGPSEVDRSLEDMLSDSTLRLLATLVPKEHMVRLNGRAMEVNIFERGRGRRWQTLDTLLMGLIPRGAEDVRADTMLCVPGAFCFPGMEYPLEITGLDLEEVGMCFADLVIRGEASWPDGAGEAQLVFSEDHPAGAVGYRSSAMGDGAFEHRYRIPPRSSGTFNKLYIWNIGKKPFRLRGLVIEVVRTFQEE